MQLSALRPEDIRAGSQRAGAGVVSLVALDPEELLVRRFRSRRIPLPANAGISETAAGKRLSGKGRKSRPDLNG
jgi:hypothetical protein